MVHYNPRSAAQQRPPRCPKCGSHKTEIVGKSQDMKIIYLRCAAFAVRSVEPYSNETYAVKMSESHDNELAIELDALQAIGRALARVNDPKTRRRILQWANERFGEMPSAPIHEERPAAAADPSLTVDGVELFG